jgi:hypothetical protein
MAKIPASVLNDLPKYKKVGEALSLVAKGNPKDKIEVVVGDDGISEKIGDAIFSKLQKNVRF